MSKQTAIEWLIDELDYETISKFNFKLEKAKEMEKQQMIKFANDYLDDDADLTAEQYYTEIYGTNKKT